MFYFAHNSIEHHNDVGTALHHWPSIVALSLVSLALLGVTYWILTYKSEPQEQEEDKE